MGGSDSPLLDSVAAAASRAVLDGVPANVGWLDADGVLLGVNEPWRAFMQAHGREAECRPGVNYLELRGRLEREAGVEPGLCERIRAVLEGREARFTAEYRSVLARGERWYRVTVMPLEIGGAPGAVITWWDLTEERDAQRALARNEASLRRTAAQLEHIVNASHDVICAFDAEGRFLQVSAACARVWGYQPAELVGQRFLDFVYPDDRTPALHAGMRVLAGEPVRHLESRWVRKDGSVCHVQWTCQWSHEMSAAFGVARDVSEAKLIEEAGRVLNERLRVTLDNMNDAFMTLDARWRMTFVNQAFARLAGRDAAELTGRILWAEYPDALESSFHAHYARALREQVSVEFEEYYEPLQLWLEVRAHPTPDGLAVYFRDITERHRARAALVESEERFKHVASATNDAIWDWDVKRNRVWWNDGVEKLFGASRSSAMVTDWWESCLHPADRARVIASLDRAVASGERRWSAEYRFRRLDGAYAHVLDRASIVRDASGNAVRMVGGMTDVTAQREFEDRLRERSALLDSARDAIHVRDLDHRIHYWNRSAETLYGWTSEEVLGRSFDSLFGVEPGLYAEATGRLLRDGEFVGDLEKTRKDGRRLLVEARWTLLRDPQGRPHRVLAIEGDVTERRFLERQHTRSQRLESLGTLAGGIAHDLNNVFTPILMSASLLARPDLNPEDQELVAAVRKSAQRGADMVRHLVSFARGAEGRHEPVRVSEIVADAAKLASDTLPKNIRVELELEQDLCEVAGDATQLHQVLMNLCVNARDAMPEGGRIAIRARNATFPSAQRTVHGELPAGAYVLVEVEDSGCGIPPGDLEKIFEPFFTTKEHGRGSGLGLATSLAILRSHRGSMQVESHPGVGSRFRLFLPARSVRTWAPAEHDEAAPRGSGQVVLVVDDEIEILEAARRALTGHGYRVIVARDGPDALARFGPLAGSVDLALVDMMMPLMDGAETIERLKRLDPGLRVVASSGYATREQATKAQAAGVRSFLAKPYTLPVLLRTVAQALEG